LTKYAGIELRIVAEDALTYPSDLLVLKYAQASFGLDLAAVDAARIDPARLPTIGQTLLAKKPDSIAPKNLLFIGTESFGKFNYPNSSRLLASCTHRCRET
jgi:hypothetical protein